jgi:hypothetical protein
MPYATAGIPSIGGNTKFMIAAARCPASTTTAPLTAPGGDRREVP